MKLKSLVLLLVFANVASAQQWFRSGQNADLMLSGVDFNNTGGPLLFNHPSGIASDGTHFLLCDRFNNRVLIWNALPTKWDALPDLVLGQENFITNNTGASRSGLSFPGNVSVSANGVVTVADEVAVWNTLPLNGEAPSYILTNRLGSMPLQNLRGVALDGNYFYLAGENGTLGIWRSLPATSNDEPFAKLTIANTPLNHLHSDGTYLCVAAQSAQPAIYIYRVADIVQGNTVQPFKTIDRLSHLPLNQSASAS